MKSRRLSESWSRSRVVQGRSKRKWLLALTFLALLAAIAAAVVLPRRPTLAAMRPIVAATLPDVRWISTEELARRIQSSQGQKILLLDARTRDEYQVSHLAEALRVEPDKASFADLAVPSNALIVVYCSVGYRSAVVADGLREAGYQEVVNLEGGIFQWANEGRPLYRSGNRAATVHPYDDTWGTLLRSDLRAPLT